MYCRTSEKSHKIKGNPQILQAIELLHFSLSFPLEEVKKEDGFVCLFVWLVGWFVAPFYSQKKKLDRIGGVYLRICLMFYSFAVAVHLIDPPVKDSD